MSFKGSSLLVFLAVFCGGCSSHPQLSQLSTFQPIPGLEHPREEMVTLKSETLPNLWDHGDRYVQAPGKIGFHIVLVDGRYSYGFQELLLPPGDHELVLFFQGGLIADGRTFPNLIKRIHVRLQRGHIYRLQHSDDSIPKPLIVDEQSQESIPVDLLSR